MFWQHVISIAEYAGFFASGYACMYRVYKKKMNGKFRCTETLEVEDTYHGKLYLPRCCHELGHIGPCMVECMDREFNFDPEKLTRVKTR